MSRLIVVSNRVTKVASRTGQAGGLAIALLDVLKAQKGIWFGWSGEIAAATSTSPQITEMGNITYATVDLCQADYNGYYLGFSNNVLWPLLHFQPGYMKYDTESFNVYQHVNQHFAQLLHKMIQPDDVIWVHDYHLIPLAAALRALGVTNKIGFFLHTPFPPNDLLTALPMHDVLLRAMDQYDIVGFQTNESKAAYDDAIAHLKRHRPHAKTGVFPIGIDNAQFSRMARRATGFDVTRRLTESLGSRKMILSVDRLDYSKGIPQRLMAISNFLDTHREWRSKFNYLQITPHSRHEVETYRLLCQEIDALTGRINGQFAEFDWTPIRYLNKAFSRSTLAGFYRLSAVGLVTPLRDGMNLVAKEYVAAQDPDSPGCLILSRFAGAAQELNAALLVNPLDVDDVANAIRKALTMSLEERQDRWEAMNQALRANSVMSWRDSFLQYLQPPQAEAADLPDDPIFPVPLTLSQQKNAVPIHA